MPLHSVVILLSVRNKPNIYIFSKILAFEKPKVLKKSAIFKVQEVPSSLDARIEAIREEWKVKKREENWKKKGDNFF